MADPAAIAAVKVQLPDEAVTLGVTDAYIAALLDVPTTQTKTILASWRAIAAKTVMVEDVSESGSSRTSRLHENAREMITIWQARADMEDKLAVTDTLGHGRFASHKATRV